MTHPSDYSFSGAHDSGWTAWRRTTEFSIAARPWHEGSWPMPPRSHDEYTRIRSGLVTYVLKQFADLVETAECHQLVESTLTMFMAFLHVGRPARGSPADPGDLVRAVEDAVLDWVSQRSDISPSDGLNTNDAMLVRQAFGGLVSPDLYRSVLADLVAEGRTLEFRVISAYVEELEQPSSSPPDPREVAIVLRDFLDRVAAKSQPPTP